MSESNFSGAISPEKSAQQASVENVPIREVGMGKNTLHSPNPLDDERTEKRRAHYGEDPAFQTPKNEIPDMAQFNVNQVPTPNNPTMQDEVILNQKSGFARAMCA